MLILFILSLTTSWAYVMPPNYFLTFYSLISLPPLATPTPPYQCHSHIHDFIVVYEPLGLIMASRMISGLKVSIRAWRWQVMSGYTMGGKKFSLPE